MILSTAGAHRFIWLSMQCVVLAQCTGGACRRDEVVTSRPTFVYGTLSACESAMGSSLDELRLRGVVSVLGPGIRADVSATEYSKDGRCLLLSVEGASGWVVDNMRSIQWLGR